MADAPNLGASPFVISSRAFQGHTRNPSGDAPSLTLAGVKSRGGWKVATDDIERDRPACEGE